MINETAYQKKFFNVALWAKAIEKDIYISKIIDSELKQHSFQQQNSEQNRVEIPWIYKPYYREERMNSQSSIFILWGAEKKGLTSFMKTENYMLDDIQVPNKEEGIICNISIPANKKDYLLLQLNELGINEKFIYPGVDGIGRYVKQKYSNIK